MGAQLKYGTAGATGGGWSHQPGTLQPAYLEEHHEAWWQWQCRALWTRNDKMLWRSRWSFGCSLGYGTPAGSDGAAPVGGDMLIPDRFEPMAIQDGCQSLKWLRGQCVDASDVAITDATVQCFRTSDDAFGGESVSLADGTYRVPTPFVGVAHYVVAYKPGSPDVGGTTVNTLTPANLDGS